MDDQERLKLLLKEARKLVGQMCREEAEDREEEEQLVSLGYVPVEALREELEAQASSADDLHEFNTVWLRYELTKRIDSDEWQKRTEDAVAEMLKGIATRLLKNAKRRRRSREKTTKQPKPSD